MAIAVIIVPLVAGLFVLFLLVLYGAMRKHEMDSGVGQDPIDALKQAWPLLRGSERADLSRVMRDHFPAERGATS